MPSGYHHPLMISPPLDLERLARLAALLVAAVGLEQARRVLLILHARLTHTGSAGHALALLALLLPGVPPL